MKSDVNGVDTYTVDMKADGAIASNDVKAVSGDTVYADTRVVRDGNYVVSNTSVKDNLMALDTALKDVSDVANQATNGLDGKANVGLDNISTDGETVIRELAKGSVKVVAGTDTTVTEDVDGDAKIYAVNVVKDGVVADGNEGIVTGNAVYDAIQDAVSSSEASTTVSLAGKANVDASNVTNAEAWGEKIAIGEVAQGDVRAVSGDTIAKLANDLRGESTMALDTKVNTNLDNITVDGEEIIKILAKGAVNVKSGDNTNVVKTNENGVDTYIVHAIANGRVEENDEGIVNGGTVYSAIEIAKQDVSANIDTKLEGYAKVDASNVMNASAWADVIGTGSVNTNDGKLVTGRTVANETRVSSDGNYVQQTNTAGQNLSELDRVLKETRDIAEAAALTGTDTSAVHYDGADKETITLAGNNGTIITNLKDGELSANSKDAVTGKQLFETNKKVAENTEQITALNDKIGTVSDGNYVSSDKTIGGNLDVLDTQLKTVSDGLDTVRTDVTNLQNTLTETANGKADTDLGNITDDGKTVIADIAKGSVKVKGSGLATVTSAEEGQATVYTVDVQADGMVENGNTGLVNGGTVYNSIQEVRNDFTTGLGGKADVDLSNITDSGKEKIKETMQEDLDKKANADASNINPDAWSEKLGTGEIADGNTGLVNGGTVYNAIKDVQDNALVQTENDMIRIGGNSTASTIDVSNANGEGRVITGIATDPSDLSSAANVGYVNAIGQNIINGVNDGFSKIDDKVGRVGASAAAMASLPTPPMDGDEKWAVSAAVGHYDGKTAGAVGAFYKPQDNVIFNIRGAVGNGEDMVGAGVGIALNRPGSKGVTKASLVKAVNAQAQVIHEMRAEREADRARLAQQDKQIAELQAAVSKLVSQKQEK